MFQLSLWEDCSEVNANTDTRNMGLLGGGMHIQGSFLLLFVIVFCFKIKNFVNVGGSDAGKR